jgi:tetratricopeptide (TPR) repeat protein
MLYLSAVLSLAFAQAPAKKAPAPAVDPEKTAKLFDSGHCPEALPLFRKAYARANEGELKRRLGAGGVRCAMSLNDTSLAADIIQMSLKDFPKDPDILYLAVHTYSDLSLRASQALLFAHPDAYQVHELNAESLETQGKWDEAAEEYGVMLKQNPGLPGIHYRLGRIILSKPETPATYDTAKKEFEEELRIDPNNAGAEYVLGALARRKGDYKEAAERFTRATQLDATFADAFLGLGECLIGAGKAEEAVAPLERAVKLQPDNPATHFQLANAYRLTHRQEDMEREIEAYKNVAQKARQATDERKKAVSGITDKP